MIKISAGPMVQRYAELFDVPVGEVVAWMSSYINEPANWQKLQELGLYEATEAERAESIKTYVKDQVKSVTMRRAA